MGQSTPKDRRLGSKSAKSESKEKVISPLLQSGSFLLSDSGTTQRLDSSTSQVNWSAGSQHLSPFPGWVKQLPMVVENMVFEIRELGGVLIVGSAIAAIVQVAVPREIIISLGQGPVSSIIAMLVLATVVSICSTVDAFFCPVLCLHFYHWVFVGLSGVWPDDRSQSHWFALVDFQTQNRGLFNDHCRSTHFCFMSGLQLKY